MVARIENLYTEETQVTILKYPHRKPIRLTQFDYASPSAYFITVCTNKRKPIFWNAPTTQIYSPQDVPLSPFGMIAEDAIKKIPLHYSAISVDHYAILPDHVHLLLRINSEENGRPMVAPTLSIVIQQMKGIVSKAAGFSVWQKGFYDHIIRGEQDYREVWEYIESNPQKWVENHS